MVTTDPRVSFMNSGVFMGLRLHIGVTGYDVGGFIGEKPVTSSLEKVKVERTSTQQIPSSTYSTSMQWIAVWKFV
jgi:hypothetical protein